MTLREIAAAMWDITHVTVTARDADGKFLHEWMYGPDITESIHMYHERVAGRLTIVEGKINAHGDADRRGFTEIGWGLKPGVIPKDILDAPVTVLHVTPSYSRETHVRVDVTMHELTVMGLIPREEEDG